MKLKLRPMASLLALLFCIFGSWDASAGALETFDKTMGIVSEKFYDRTFRGLPWARLVAEARAGLGAASTDAELQAVVNGLLGRLHASHTKFLLAAEPEYWALRSIFGGQIDAAPACQAGMWLERSAGGGWFVSAIWDSAAIRAGLLPGDEILSAGGAAFEPIRSLCASPARLLVRRHPSLPPWEMEVGTNRGSFQRGFLQASYDSGRLLESGDKAVGYFHLWAGTHDDFKWALRSAVQRLGRGADAFVLDLRGGFGGADPSYLEAFEDTFRGPLVALIDEGTRSGKEWLAAVLKQKKRAFLMGTRTAGAFLGGQVFEIEADRALLYLAVSAGGPPGMDIEGRGVEPDEVVPMDRLHAQGEDPQLVRALKKAAALSRSL